jgi:hypothetical protein
MESLYQVYAQVKIDKKDEADVLTALALKRICERQITDPKYDKPVPAIALNKNMRLVVLNDGYELVGPPAE